MPMEHYRPDGSLSQGYYCTTCGMPCSMMGHRVCEKNPELVKQLREINRTKGWNGEAHLDFSKIEQRVIASQAFDFVHPTPDSHTKEAMRIFECSQDEVTPTLRRAAKAVHYLKLYHFRKGTIVDEKV